MKILVTLLLALLVQGTALAQADAGQAAWDGLLKKHVRWLPDGIRRFMGDRTRNRFKDGKLEVSAIFKWFREDFEKGHKGIAKLDDVFARYATLLSDDAGEQARIKAGGLPVNFLDYDWTLNVIGR